MVRVTFISHDGQRQQADLSPGQSLMEGAVGNGISGIDAECGGNCYCGTCRIYPSPEWADRLGVAGEYEVPVIASTGDASPGVRLSCQIMVSDALDGLVVHLPEAQS